MRNAAHVVCVAADFPHFILPLCLALVPQTEDNFEVLFLTPPLMQKIGVILAMDIDANISFAARLHLIHHPNNMKR